MTHENPTGLSVIIIVNKADLQNGLILVRPKYYIAQKIKPFVSQRAYRILVQNQNPSRDIIINRKAVQVQMVLLISLGSCTK